MRVALLQITSSDQPAENISMLSAMVREAAANGADLILTPEVSNCVSVSRKHQLGVLQTQDVDPMLASMEKLARELDVWILLGSLALKTDDPDGRFANRSFLLNSRGQVAGQYDKIHMFDVSVTPEETYRESDGYRPGQSAVLARTPFCDIGMSVCYDVRFPHLYRALAQVGAKVLTVPAAFSPITGAAHWEVLLRARAIETGCYVLAPAQTGLHPSTGSKQRRTYGHSLVVSPWGEVLADAGADVGITYVDLDLTMVDKARRQVPALSHDRTFGGP